MNSEKQRIFIIKIVYYALIAALIYIVLLYLLPILMPFLLAFFVVWLLKKPAAMLSKKMKVSQRLTHPALLIVFYLALFGIIIYAGTQLFSVAGSGLPRLPAFYHQTLLPAMNSSFSAIEEVVARFDPAFVTVVEGSFTQVAASLGDTISALSKAAMQSISGFVASMPVFFIKLLMMVVSSFFLATDYRRVTFFLMNRLSEKQRQDLLKIKNRLTRSVSIYIRSYSLLLAITFTELLIGLWILKIPNAPVIAALIAIFDLLPILGTGGILIPWAVVLFIMKDIPLGIGVLVLYLVIVVVRNTLEPRLVGKQIGLHPLATLISLFVGGQLFGIVGLFGLPVALSLVVQFQREKLEEAQTDTQIET